MTTDYTALLTHHARCGACAGELDRGRLNLVSMRYRPAWEYPTASNFITGDGPCAVGVVCDECVAAGSPIVEAIEIDEGAVRTHAVGSMQSLGPPSTYAPVDEGRALLCLVCGQVSYDPTEVALKYCGVCRKFHAVKEAEHAND